MSSNIHHEAELLRKRSKASRIQADWRALLRNACGVALTEEDFLDVAQTSTLKVAFFDRVKRKENMIHRYWRQNAFQEVIGVLARLAAPIGDRPVILFRAVWISISMRHASAR
jgi:hypothetical protein